MVRLGVIRLGMIRLGVIRLGVIWLGMILLDRLDLIRYGWIRWFFVNLIDRSFLVFSVCIYLPISLFEYIYIYVLHIYICTHNCTVVNSQVKSQLLMYLIFTNIFVDMQNQTTIIFSRYPASNQAHRLGTWIEILVCIVNTYVCYTHIWIYWIHIYIYIHTHRIHVWYIC